MIRGIEGGNNGTSWITGPKMTTGPDAHYVPKPIF